MKYTLFTIITIILLLFAIYGTAKYVALPYSDSECRVKYGKEWKATYIAGHHFCEDTSKQLKIDY